MKKTSIEDANLDMLELFESVSKEARREKTAVPPVSKMIYYWTRKPLIVGRVVALASTLDSAADVKSLLGIYGDKRAYTRIPRSRPVQRKTWKGSSDNQDLGSVCRHGKPDVSCS